MDCPEVSAEGSAPVGKPNSALGLLGADPSVSFESVTFSDGTTVEIEPNDVVVLVGPNNTGKSLALRELQEYVGSTPDTKVISSAKLRTTGTPESFENFIHKNTRVESKDRGNSLNIQGYGVSLGFGGVTLASMWPAQIANFRPLFCQRIATERRITDSNPVNSIDLLTENPSHPIHLLYEDQVENRISGYFKDAFGKELILYRGGGRTSHLLVGQRLILQDGEDRGSASYCRRLLAVTERLEEQGDGMRSFASVVLHLLAPVTPSILLLDEPEAFLHPPQARLLGDVIADEKSSRAQLFVATHSPDVLQGLIDVAPEHLTVLRIQREGNVNRVKELDKELVKGISTDPLMKLSSVLAGVFHERVVLCEGEPDCLFYHSLLTLPEVRGDRHPDVLFIDTNGKHRMPHLAKTLTSLGVPVEVVVDMDVLNNTGVFRGIVEALHGDWAQFEASARAVKQAVEVQKRSLTVNEIKPVIQEVLDAALNTNTTLDSLKREIDAQFGKASPWDTIKSAGYQGLPPDGATRHFQNLQSLCKSIGLWIVPVGQLESFCKEYGGHGSSWVQAVLEQLDLATAPELEHARSFMREMWISREAPTDDT